MISIASLLQPQNVLLGIAATSKKRVFEQASQALASLCGLPKMEIFDGLMQREKLGSTYLGHGIAIPHCRLPKLKTPVALFVRMNGYLGVDKSKEEIRSFLFLLVPEGTAEDAQNHLLILQQAALLFENEKELEKLRATTTAKDFSHTVQEWVDNPPPEETEEEKEPKETESTAEAEKDKEAESTKDTKES
ncbi:MAG: PTS sugar transporter subunit IIA [Burkholderiales bacterium]|nr:PTS sugar transporter subunit IIA [Burkholderiales bacterium]